MIFIKYLLNEGIVFCLRDNSADNEYPLCISLSFLRPSMWRGWSVLGNSGGGEILPPFLSSFLRRRDHQVSHLQSVARFSKTSCEVHVVV